MRMPPTARREVQGLLQRAPLVALGCLLLAAAALAMGGSAIGFGAGTMCLAGAVGALLLVFSWRHYQPHWSWLLWAVPTPAILAVAFEVTVAPVVSSGEVSIVSGIWVLLGCGGLGFFGSLFLLRGHIQRWLGT